MSIRNVISATNVVGYAASMIGLSILLVSQFLTTLLPLLFAPTVCGIFCLLVYSSRPSAADVNAGVNTFPTGLQQ